MTVLITRSKEVLCGFYNCRIIMGFEDKYVTKGQSRRVPVMTDPGMLTHSVHVRRAVYSGG